MLISSALVLAVMAVIDILRPISPEQRLRVLRERMTALRVAADSCQEALAREEASLRASDERFDSLRSRIQHFESLDPRGVPADSYSAYLKTFNAYNQAVPGRAAAGETLRAHWTACRDIIARHNAVADSALEVATELGLVRDSLIRSPVPADSPTASPGP